jgi:hypothetical protein
VTNQRQLSHILQRSKQHLFHREITQLGTLKMESGKTLTVQRLRDLDQHGSTLMESEKTTTRVILKELSMTKISLKLVGDLIQLLLSMVQQPLSQLLLSIILMENFLP